jgi:4-carboxymuconolactone decarboxylase
MNKIVATIAASAIATTGAEAEDRRPRVAPPAVYETAPGLGHFTDHVLFGEVWERTELSPRDRSLVTVATLVSTGKAAQVGNHVRRALDNGLKPEEVGELITHLAFYSGWPNAMSAAAETKKVFEEAGIRGVASSDADRIQPEAPRRFAMPRSIRTLRRRPPLSQNLPTECSSAICGSVPICLPATAAW